MLLCTLAILPPRPRLSPGVSTRNFQHYKPHCWQALYHSSGLKVLEFSLCMHLIRTSTRHLLCRLLLHGKWLIPDEPFQALLLAACPSPPGKSCVARPLPFRSCGTVNPSFLRRSILLSSCVLLFTWAPRSR